MIWSVSTLLARSGAAVPVCEMNFSMTLSLQVSAGSDRGQVGGGGELAHDGGGGGDGGRDEVRLHAGALTAFEVAVRGGRAALAGSEVVGVHADAHRAARAAPLGARGLEDLVQTLGL